MDVLSNNVLVIQIPGYSGVDFDCLQVHKGLTLTKSPWLKWVLLSGSQNLGIYPCRPYLGLPGVLMNRAFLARFPLSRLTPNATRLPQEIYIPLCAASANGVLYFQSVNNIAHKTLIYIPDISTYQTLNRDWSIIHWS